MSQLLNLNPIIFPLVVVITLSLVIVALKVKALRKTLGLLLVVLGGLICLSIIGLIIGIPMIIVGGLLLFI